MIEFIEPIEPMPYPWEYLACAICTALVLSAIWLFWGEKAAERRRLAKSHPVETIIVFAFICFATLIGATKPSVRFDGLLTPSDFLATNDTVRIAWTYDRYTGLPTDTVCVDYRLSTSTNAADWVELGRTTVNGSPFIANVPSATNYQYSVYAIFVPIVPVVTNGVYHLGMKMPATNRVISVGSEIKKDGQKIAPPSNGE